MPLPAQVSLAGNLCGFQPPEPILSLLFRLRCRLPAGFRARDLPVHRVMAAVPSYGGLQQAQDGGLAERRRGEPAGRVAPLRAAHENHQHNLIQQ